MSHESMKIQLILLARHHCGNSFTDGEVLPEIPQPNLRAYVSQYLWSRRKCCLFQKFNAVFKNSFATFK